VRAENVFDLFLGLLHRGQHSEVRSNIALDQPLFETLEITDNMEERLAHGHVLARESQIHEVLEIDHEVLAEEGGRVPVRRFEKKTDPFFELTREGDRVLEKWLELPALGARFHPLFPRNLP